MSGTLEDEVCTSNNPYTEFWISGLCKVCYPDNPCKYTAIAYNKTKSLSLQLNKGTINYTMLPRHNHPGAKPTFVERACMFSN